MLCQDKNLEHNICAPLTIICCVNLVFIESTVNLFKQFNVIYFIIKASVSKLMKKTEPGLCCLVHTLVPEVFLDIFLRKRERERDTRVKNLHGIPWNSMDFHGKCSMEFHGGLGHQFPWNSMEISP